MAKSKDQNTKMKRTKPVLLPKKSGEIPLSKSQLDAVEASLSKQMTTLKIEMTALKQDTKTLRLEMKAGFSKMGDQLAKMFVLMEDQKSENRYALDGYTSIHDEHSALKDRVKNLEKVVLGKEQE